MLAVHALLPVSKLACFSLWLGFPSHSDPGWGQTQPLRPDHSREATHADVQLSAVGPQLHRGQCGGRRAWGPSAELHAADHEHSLPVHPLHHLRVPAGADQPLPSYNPQSHIISGGLAGALAAAARHPLDVCKTLLNTPGRTWPSTWPTSATAVGHGQCLPDGVPAQWPAWVLQRCAGPGNLPDAIHRHLLVCL